MVSARKQQETDTFLQSHGMEHLTSLRTKQRAWNAAWMGDSPETRALREKWGNDGKRYRARFRPDEVDMLRLMTEGMQYLTTLQAQTLKRAKYDSLLQTGEAALEALMGGLITGAPTEYEFVSLDFEGNDMKGITEFGITKLAHWRLDTQESLMDSLQSLNYILRAKSKQKYRFGRSTRLSSELLPRTILKELEVSPEEQDRPRLIIVGHGVHADLRMMEQLGLKLEKDVPQFAGVIDTMVMAKRILGRGSSLEDLLKHPEVLVPFDWRHLHCAGNDARYTMQAMLALLHIQAVRGTTSSEGLDRLESLLTVARQPLQNRETIDAPDKSDSLIGNMERDIDDGLFGDGSSVTLDFE